ncbi:unnamed protein product, partial [Closterium sp. NIES-53]
MYAVTDGAEGDCYLCVPPDPGIEAAALGASESAALGTGESAAPGAGESTLSGTAPTEALHTFTLDSGASRSFFRDSTTLTPLNRPVAVSLADPSGGPVLAHSSTVLPCLAAPSGLLSGLHLPSFSTNLTGRHLATFTRRPGSSLYTLTTASPPVTASGQVAASSQVFAAASRSSLASAPCSCRPLSHETLLWNHHLGHPSLPRLRGMASRTLVLGLPRSLPPLPPGPAPTCVPCVEVRQRAAPHSSEFPPTEAPLQTLNMDVWGPAHRGGEFSSDLLRAFSRAEGIRQTFTLMVQPYGLHSACCPCACMRVCMECFETLRGWGQCGTVPHHCTSALGYAAHQINLQPRFSLPETTPTLRWTGKVGDASVFRVWGSRAFIRDTSVDKLSSRAISCVFLGFPPNAPGWQFYHPTSRRVLSSQDVTFDESVSYYRLFPYRTAPLPPPPATLPSTRCSSGRPPPPSGSCPLRVRSHGGAEPERVEPGGAEPGGAESGGAEPGGAEREHAASGGPPGVPSRREILSPQRLLEWYARRCSRAARATGPTAGGASGAGSIGGAAGAGAAGGASRAGAAGGAGGAGAAGTGGPGGAGTGGSGAAGGPAGVGAAR